MHRSRNLDLEKKSIQNLIKYYIDKMEIMERDFDISRSDIDQQRYIGFCNAFVSVRSILLQEYYD